MYLNHRATLQCIHGGRVLLIPPPMRSLRIMQSPVVTDTDLMTAIIVGCPQIGPGIKPCIKIVAILAGRSLEIKVDGQTPILDSLQAMTDGNPPGLVSALNDGGSNATPAPISVQSLTMTKAGMSGAALLLACVRPQPASDGLAEQKGQDWDKASQAAAMPATAAVGPGTTPAPKGSHQAKPASPITPALHKEIAKSPTLSKQVAALTKSRWHFKYGANGGGTFADRTNKTITVDPAQSSNPELLVESLAHEAGHASRPAPVFKPIAPGQSKADFVKANVHESLLDEADATLNNIKVKHELAKNKGLQIGVAGANGAKYEAAYKKNPKTAREEIAKVFGGGEHPSNQPNSTYDQYYGKVYEDYYDKVNP